MLYLYRGKNVYFDDIQAILKELSAEIHIFKGSNSINSEIYIYIYIFLTIQNEH